MAWYLLINFEMFSAIIYSGISSPFPGTPIKYILYLFTVTSMLFLSYIFLIHCLFISVLVYFWLILALEYIFRVPTKYGVLVGFLTFVLLACETAKTVGWLVSAICLVDQYMHSGQWCPLNNDHLLLNFDLVILH